jgi:pimeloyl-ACP methyl ester carboxylesterase
VLNSGTITASGGTLTIDGDVSGYGVMTVDPGLSELVLTASVAGGQTIEFGGSGGAVFVGGILSIADVGDFDGTISNFQKGDTIDLTGVSFPPAQGDEGLEANFDADTGVLTIDDVQFGATTTLVGSFQFIGDLDGQTFALSSDGHGGTEITLGPPAPNLLQLADMDDATYEQASYSGPLPGVAYSGPATIVNGYTIVDGTSDSAGMLADVFEDGNQLVIAVRGTDPSHLYNTIKNLLADTSWAAGALGLPSGSPNSILTQEVTDAAQFLDQVREQYPEETITLTGHSLGAAVAQLLGYASGYTAVGFNAPGVAQFAGTLASELVPAALASDLVLGLPNDNFRLQGDQVSLVGTPIGEVFTSPSLTSLSDSWGDVFANHSMDTVAQVIENGSTATITAGGISGVPDSFKAGEPDSRLPLSDLIQPVSTVIDGTTSILGISFVVNSIALVGAPLAGLAAAFFAIDPGGATSYQLVGSASSPDFSGFSLPSYPGVATYNISLLVNGVWEPNESVVPGDIFGVAAGDTGIEYSAVGGNGNLFTLPDGYIIDAAFASMGTFNGTLTEGLACFRCGTWITTADGAAPVETLRKGDMVQTHFGGLLSVKWIGHRHVDCSRHPMPTAVWPVRIIAGAFGDRLPFDDLWLSPDHAVFVDGILIPVKYLINSISIVQEPLTEVTYFHVELSYHDVLYANGLPAESYLDTGNRAVFDNYDGPITLCPGSSALMWEAMGCAPLIVTGRDLADVYRRLVNQADLACSGAR